MKKLTKPGSGIKQVVFAGFSFKVRWSISLWSHSQQRPITLSGKKPEKRTIMMMISVADLREKKYFGRPPRLPYLRVWMTVPHPLILRSG